MSLRTVIETHQDNIYRMQSLVNPDDVLRIAVCGVFKSGKTSIINELLGLDLPVKAISETHAITQIAWDDNDYVISRNGDKALLSHETAKDYIRMRPLPEHVSRILIGCHHDLLADGKVEVWDTPGITDSGELDEMAISALESCDVALLVLDATKLLGRGERELVGKLSALVGGNVIVTVNRCNALDEDEFEEVEEVVRLSLGEAGNACSGYGPAFISKEDEGLDVSPIAVRLEKACLDPSAREACKRESCMAKLRTVSRLHSEELLDAILEHDEEIDDRKIEIESKINDQLRVLKRRTEEDRKAIANILTKAIARVNDRSSWESVLVATKVGEDWDKQYTSKSRDAMIAEARRIIEDAYGEIYGSIPRQHYPDIFPLPNFVVGDSFSDMDWGRDFDADNMGGMVAGAAAGAAAGSVIPGIGTLFGAAVGFVLGAARDAGADDRERRAFRSSCVKRTLDSFYGGPSNHLVKKLEYYKSCINKKVDESVAAQMAKIESMRSTDQTLVTLKKKRESLQRYYTETTQLIADAEAKLIAEALNRVKPSTKAGSLGYSEAKSQSEMILRDLEEFSLLVGPEGTGVVVDGVVAGIDGMETMAKALSAAADGLKKSKFVMLFMGTFNNGKSTTINALLGARRLPVRMTEATAVISRVTYGEDEDTVTIHYSDGKAPRTITSEQFLKEFVGTIGERLVLRNDSLNRIEVVSYYSSDEICRSGVELVVSPGLGASVQTEQRTRDFMREANAVVVLLDATHLFSDKERGVIQRLFINRAQMPRNVFFLVNRINMLEDEADRRDVCELAEETLAPVFTRSGEFDEDLMHKRLFYVDSKGALELRERGEEPKGEYVEAFYRFQQALEEYLTSKDRVLDMYRPSLACMARTCFEAEEIVRKNRLLRITISEGKTAPTTRREFKRQGEVLEALFNKLSHAYSQLYGYQPTIEEIASLANKR